MKTNSMGHLVSEKKLQEDALRRIRSLACVIACSEVPLLGRIVDLVYLESNKIITVEFKIRDWRRAILQARDHLLGADYSYICMPKRRVTDSLKEELRKVGIGLIFYRSQGEWPFETIITAPKSKETWKMARLNLLEYLSKENADI